MADLITIRMTADQTSAMLGHLSDERNKIAQIVKHFAQINDDEKQYSFWQKELDQLDEILKIIDDATDLW